MHACVCVCVRACVCVCVRACVRACAVLGFNESFTYSSLCPLSLDKEYLAKLPESRVLGSMEGSYLIVTGVRLGFRV